MSITPAAACIGRAVLHANRWKTPAPSAPGQSVAAQQIRRMKPMFRSNLYSLIHQLRFENLAEDRAHKRPYPLPPPRLPPPRPRLRPPPPLPAPAAPPAPLSFLGEPLVLRNTLDSTATFTCAQTQTRQSTWAGQRRGHAANGEKMHKHRGDSRGDSFRVPSPIPTAPFPPPPPPRSRGVRPPPP